ncbi:MAG: aromatic ring-hydroxylating dioxygenase subunit alpha, partial [Planctomycetes bacterium]|nr:aromatic ring-hydroxylating dioxygenase subunit alpha [Planctomycetota bacterium]
LQGQRPPYAAIWLCLFSGQLVEWYPGALVVTTYMPLTPTRTRLHSEYYFDRRIAESRRDFVQACLAVLDEVTEEDHVASVALQDGRRALYDRGVDVPGPYQIPMEQGIRGFHDCLRAIVDV